MKTPKFRAWHKSEKRMCNVTVLTDKGAFLEGIKSGEDQYIDGGKKVIRAPKDGRFCESDEFELMMGTSVFDKNGVEIFDNDIILGGNKKKYHIYYGEFTPPDDNTYTQLGFYYLNPRNGWSEPFDPEKTDIYYEVIGNIFQ